MSISPPCFGCSTHGICFHVFHIVRSLFLGAHDVFHGSPKKIAQRMLMHAAYEDLRTATVNAGMACVLHLSSFALAGPTPFGLDFQLPQLKHVFGW